MANTSAPRSNRFKGWFFDGVNNRLEYYFNGTKIGHLNSSGFSVTDDTTARITDGQTTLAGTGTGNTRQHVTILGTAAAVASNGAGAILPVPAFVAPFDLKIVGATRVNNAASDVTVGTSVSSASYRRNTIICNTAGTGSGTDIVASLNATASAASNVGRSFTTVASTVPAGSLVRISHLTVGAETADGTDMGQATFIVAYEKV